MRKFKNKAKRVIKRQLANYGFYWLTGTIVTVLVSKGIIQQTGISYRIVRTILHIFF